MGGGSRAGKMEMHAKGKPHVITSKCVGCGRCAKICAHGAPIITDKKCAIDHDKCLGCGRCIAICPKDAIAPDCDEIAEVLNYKIAEYAKAVVDGRPSFHISIVRDISPDCDCHPENDVPMVPDVGMFASFDPVALDLACGRRSTASRFCREAALQRPQTPRTTIICMPCTRTPAGERRSSTARRSAWVPTTIRSLPSSKSLHTDAALSGAESAAFAYIGTEISTKLWIKDGICPETLQLHYRCARALAKTDGSVYTENQKTKGGGV